MKILYATFIMLCSVKVFACSQSYFICPRASKNFSYKEKMLTELIISVAHSSLNDVLIKNVRAPNKTFSICLELNDSNFTNAKRRIEHQQLVKHRYANVTTNDEKITIRYPINGRIPNNCGNKHLVIELICPKHTGLYEVFEWRGKDPCDLTFSFYEPYACFVSFSKGHHGMTDRLKSSLYDKLCFYMMLILFIIVLIFAALGVQHHIFSPLQRYLKENRKSEYDRLLDTDKGVGNKKSMEKIKKNDLRGSIDAENSMKETEDATKEKQIEVNMDQEETKLEKMDNNVAKTKESSCDEEAKLNQSK